MAFADIEQAFTVTTLGNCETVRVTDTTDYGANLDFVLSKSLFVQNSCTGENIDVGGTKQSVCFYLTGTVAAGQTYVITIDDCVFEYTVTQASLTLSDEVYASVALTVGGGTPGDTATLTDTGLLLGAAITFTIGSSDAITAKNMAIAIENIIIAQGKTGWIDVDFSSNVVTLSVSPQWYLAYLGVSPNGELWQPTITDSGGGFAYLPAAPTFADGVFPSTSINEANTQAVLQGLYDLMTTPGLCDTNFTVAIDSCDTDCQLRVTSNNPGEWFCYSAYMLGDLYGWLYADLAQNYQATFTTKAQTIVDFDYPGDTILCITLAINSSDYDPETCPEGSTKELTQCYAATCQMQCIRKSILISELSDCCDDTVCLSDATRIYNYITGIEQLAFEQKTDKACAMIAQVQNIINATGCNDCQ